MAESARGKYINEGGVAEFFDPKTGVSYEYSPELDVPTPTTPSAIKGARRQDLALKKAGLKTFYDPTTGVRFKYDPNSDVPAGYDNATDITAQEGAIKQAAFSRGLSVPKWRKMFGGMGGPSGGRGGRGAAPTFGVGALKSSSVEGLKERLINYYESWTGTQPDAPTLEWVKNQALGGKASYDIESAVENTPEFKTRYPSMPAGMDVKEYDSANIKASSMAYKIAGRKARPDEMALLFSGDGDAFFESVVKDSDG